VFARGSSFETASLLHQELGTKELHVFLHFPQELTVELGISPGIRNIAVDIRNSFERPWNKSSRHSRMCEHAELISSDLKGLISRL
jgi:hypothetical protein